MCPSLVEIEALSMFTLRTRGISATGSLKNTDCSSVGYRRVEFSFELLAPTSKKDEEWWRNERLWECKVTARRKEKREET
ncbi:hypothetical protein RhiirB3_532673 [Rhizophagus irregularis]|nr:hypothetical protein RhiirB3_532673 [Rhizophagus irregularis]